MHPAALPIRVATANDWEAVSRLLFAAFHSALDPQRQALEGTIYEPTRGLVTTDDDEVVGHAATFTRDLSVPGAVLPAAHVSQVGVSATHRRRGILTALMHRQLREFHDAGREPIAVLWASEGGIYPRFGYGLAAGRLTLRATTREVRLPEPAPGTGRVRVAPPAALRQEIARVYDEARVDRPGLSSRSEIWWDWVLADLPALRDGATELRVAVHQRTDGAVDGYATWRTRPSPPGGHLRAEVAVDEVVALTPEAHLALWRFLCHIDLTGTVRYGYAALDDPLLHLAGDPNWLGAGWNHCLWVRVVDLPAALAARRYQAPVDVVLEVTDSVLPTNAGRWRLVGGLGQATCEPTDAPADLACDVRELGAAYLGGTSLAALAAAGRVTEVRAGTLLPASTAFGWHRAPVGLGIF